MRSYIEKSRESYGSRSARRGEKCSPNTLPAVHELLYSSSRKCIRGHIKLLSALIEPNRLGQTRRDQHFELGRPARLNLPTKECSKALRKILPHNFGK
ncbi:hypothetical protein AVEN_113476-1 [Araneus ventricosus]|uniref:Uncharacterized protein n=1 Tax=Araneus ventricosus TaxID=182803 RepID=A0A4Y2KK65_ARAVE|nr:hypothetical protein AVEN_113476-1 [Araneus ventricosus]